MTERPPSEQEEPLQEEPVEGQRRSLSWAAMLMLVLLAILLAAGCAYLLVNPFFHQHPSQQN
jgi:uncharacterized integral membrane protein